MLLIWELPLQAVFFLLDWGLNPGPPSLDASTIPQGYRGGGNCVYLTG